MNPTSVSGYPTIATRIMEIAGLLAPKRIPELSSERYSLPNPHVPFVAEIKPGAICLAVTNQDARPLPLGITASTPNGVGFMISIDPREDNHPHRIRCLIPASGWILRHKDSHKPISWPQPRWVPGYLIVFGDRVVAMIAAELTLEVRVISSFEEKHVAERWLRFGNSEDFPAPSNPMIHNTLQPLHTQSIT